MKAKTVVFVMVVALVVACGAAYAMNKGAEEMTLRGGKKGPVKFPHAAHQKRLEDCKACHDLFPQEPGVIDKLKAQGKLKKKKVMNAKCVKCHKAQKKAGQASGPTSCSTCHEKKKK